jgi:hypothetical protein
MNPEATQPQAEMGPSPATGQGQTQAHRRRRRRRKNKPSNPAAQPAQVAQQAQAAPPPPPPQPVAKQAPQQRQNQGKKKKFFKKGTSPSQPGSNTAQPQQQGKRKPKQQRGPREFVGPMDHSYRVANGNVADGSNSTIPTAGNGHQSYYADLYAAPAAPVRHDAPTRIFCFIEDLFVLAKIQETARKLGVKVEFVKGDKEVVTRLTEAPENERPRLLVFDLNNANAKPMTLIPKFKSKLKKSTSIVGFLSHLQGDLKLKAVEVGCDTVMPRSAFSQTLPNLLRRYGMEEEEEYTPQPV